MTGKIWRKATVLVLIVVFAGCSDPEPERSISDLLSDVEGTALTPAEVSSLLETAELLCDLDDEVLSELLAGVEPGRLRFTDWVFSQHCASRQEFYTAVLPERLAEQVEQSDG